MPTIVYSQSVAVGGVTISGKSSRSAEGQTSDVVPLPAAKAGSLTTRTNDTEGELTLGANHGIATGQTVNVHWAGGRRYGVTVGTVNVLIVPITGGNGDNLPDEDTAITAAKVVEVDLDFDGDDAVLVAVSANKAAHLEVQEDDGDPIVAGGVDLSANDPWIWASGGPIANPLAGKVVGKLVTANSETAVGEFRFGLARNSVS